jgi:hypothetical protein
MSPSKKRLGSSFDESFMSRQYKRGHDDDDNDDDYDDDDGDLHEDM